ncbi:MAG: hypothetical protein JWM68_5266 [Verrucomicrobiales bacterium]|nr:hypothetical protein [Verrucomicrobiales bacterium]
MKKTIVVRLHTVAIALMALLSSHVFPSRAAAEERKLATLEEALAGKEDLWGKAAMQQTNGASYEFFRDLLPPLRYVNAAFRHYPIVLSAPGSLIKPRLVSNGSAINARANLSTWRETGTLVSFFVGAGESPFGQDLEHLQGPKYLAGYLPIVELDYSHGGMNYHQETFACTQKPFAEHGVLCSEFSLAKGASGIVTASLDAKADAHLAGQTLCDEKGRVLVWFDDQWKWNVAEKKLVAHLTRHGKASLAVASSPFDAAGGKAFENFRVEKEKQACAKQWEEILGKAALVNVPEAVVNNAWKASIVSSLILLKGDQLNYSAGNAYEVMYESECGDAVRALMLFGMTNRAKTMIPPLLDYGINPGLRFHDAAFKLQLLAHYYWTTRDAEFVRAQKPRWTRFVKILTDERDAKNGLLPAESYCGDIHDKVFSLNSNANGWRGLSDMANVLESMGEHEDAQRILGTANTLRKATLAAVEKSERHDVQPPFIPIALFGAEKPYDVLTSSMLGSYWDLMIPYVIGAQVFDCGSEREASMLRYLEQHGGLCMGMIRFHQHSGLFANEDGVDDCYALRYADGLLRRDEPERALVSFYGKLAQGMTRDTFLNAEGTGLRPLDRFGRPMYLPPITTGAGFFLSTLRSLLVQDYDLGNDGRPETLRLLYATPRRWLEDGKTIRAERMPTAFGEVSVLVKSQLRQGKVTAEVELPQRNAAKQILLRIRLPEGWTLKSARVSGKDLPLIGADVVDLSSLKGKQKIQFQTERAGR